MITCKFCVAKHGFKLSDKDRIFQTDEQLYEHIENQHGIPVMREGETSDQAIARCEKKGIVKEKAKCKCGDCKEERGKKIKEAVMIGR